MTVGVRRAREEDAGAVADLVNAINTLDGGEPPVRMTAEIVRRDLLGASRRAMLLLGTRDGAVAGFVTGAELYDAARAADIVMLLDLYVAPEQRRRGVARALMAGLAGEAGQRGAVAMWWGVDDGDSDAMAFYRALGAQVEEHFTGLILEGAGFRALTDAT